jgi:hypothetical protein
MKWIRHHLSFERQLTGNLKVSVHLTLYKPPTTSVQPTSAKEGETLVAHDGAGNGGQKG